VGGVRDDERQATVILVVTALLLALVAFLSVYGFLAARRWAEHLDEPIVHSYQGTTWIGDVCHVDDRGVLWCTSSG